MRSTDGNLDIAIQGRGFFAVASEGGSLFYTRQGQFQRADDGRIVTSTGHALQQEGGGDLIIQSQNVQIMSDGTIVDGGQPVGRIAVVAPRDPRQMTLVNGSSFSAPGTEMVETSDTSIRQGMLEGSNVSLGDEMLSLMTATRQAESGARLVQVYDELMGRALTTLGQRG